MADPASAPARTALGHYFDEITARFGFEIGTALEDAAVAFVAPRGAFLLAGPDDDPIACGGVQFLDEERGEIKRMWVAPSARGQGLARALLARLEQQIAASGRALSMLDTHESLTSAVRLYESSGYVRVPDYNGNADATVWFAKEL